MRPPKLNEGQQKTIRERLASGVDRKTLAREYGVSEYTIRRAQKVETFAAKGGLYTEMGVTGLNRFGGSIQEDYLLDWQQLDRLTKTVKRMLDHPTIGAIVFAVEMLLRGAKYTVEPAGEAEADAKAAEFVGQCIEDMSHTLDDHLAQAISAAWYGFAPFEIVYKRRLGPDKDPESSFDDGLVGWRKFGFRSQDTLAPGREWDFDESGGIQGMNQQAPPDWQLRQIPIDKMLLYRVGVYKNNPQGRSALRPCYIPWYFSKNLSEVEGIAAERMGAGLPIAYMGEDTKKEGSNSDFDLLKKAMRNVRVDDQMGLVIPYAKMGGGAKEGQGVLVELLAPPSKGVVDFHQTIDRYNQQIAQTLLAHFIFFGISERGTQSLAVRMTDMFTAALQGWLEILADTINRYAIPRLFRINGEAFAGMTAYPKMTLKLSSGADVGAFMNALKIGIDASVIHPDVDDEKAARELLGLHQLTDEQVAEIEEQEKQKKEMALQLQQQLAQGKGGENEEDGDGEKKPPFGKAKPKMGKDMEDEAGAMKAATRALRSIIERFRAPRAD